MDRKIQICKHNIVIIRIFKANILKGNLPFRRAHLHSLRLIKNIYISIHDLKESLNSRHSSLELLCKFNNTSYSSNQRCHIQHESDQIPGGNKTLYHKEAARHNYRQIHNTVKHFYCSLEQRHIFVGFSLDIQKFIVVHLKFPVLHILIGKGLNHLLSQKAVLNSGIQFPNLVTLFAESAPHTEIQGHTDSGHNRYKHEYDQSKRQAYLCKNHEGNYRLNPRNEKFLRTMVGKLSNIKQVVCNTAHNLSHFCIVIISIGKLLQMIIGIAAHIRFYLCPHNMTHAGHIVAGKTVMKPRPAMVFMERAARSRSPSFVI